MFNFKTLVQISMVSGLTVLSILSSSASSEDATDGSGKDQGLKILQSQADKCAPYATEHAKAISKSGANSDAAKDLEKKLNNCYSQRTGDCATDYKNALRAFGKACGAAGVPSGGGTADFPACSYNFLRCQTCTGASISPEDESTFRCSELKSKSGDENSGSGGGAMASCPWKLSAENQKLYDEQYKESRTAAKDLRKELDDLEKSDSDAQTQVLDAQQEAMEAKNSAQDDYENKMEELRKDQNQKTEELKNQIGQIEEQLRQDDDKIRQYEYSKSVALSKMNDDFRQIRLSCHSSASDTVSKLQTERLALEKVGQFRRGGFKKILKEVGLSDRQSWQRLAAKYYDYCIKSKPTADAQSAARATYALEIQKANEAISTTKAHMVGLQKAMTDIQNDKGCSGVATTPGVQNTTGDSKMCAAVADAKASMESAGRQRDRKMALADDKVRLAGMKAAMTAGSRESRLSQLKQDLKDEETRLAKLKAALAQADMANGMSTADAKTLGELRAAYYDYEDMASEVTSDRCQVRNGQCGVPECTPALKFLKAINKAPANLKPATQTAPNGTGTQSQGGVKIGTPVSTSPAAGTREKN